jgi:hypothetical protein
VALTTAWGDDQGGAGGLMFRPPQGVDKVSGGQGAGARPVSRLHKGGTALSTGSLAGDGGDPTVIGAAGSVGDNNGLPRWPRWSAGTRSRSTLRRSTPGG